MNALPSAIARDRPRREADGQRQTADRLLAALRADEFVLYAQPIVPTVPREEPLQHQEILVRFLEEEEKLLPPGSFIPTLEELGLMTYLDRWVVNRTIRWLRNRRAAKGAMRCAINLSPDALLDGSFAGFVAKQIETGGVPGAGVSFEIAWADAVALGERVTALAQHLRPLGCTFSLCSYAGEPGANAILKVIRPQFVKICGGLIGRMDRDPMDAATVEGIAGHCAELGIDTIAEHVERPETREILVDLCVDFVQGYLVGKPEPLR